MKQVKKLIVAALVLALICPAPAANAAKKTAGFTVSKKSGTYSSTVTTKVKVKKGYKVYYTTGKKLSSKKVIKAKKSKSFTFTSSKTLRLYAVKSSKKITAKKLRKIKTKNMKKYTYIITSSSQTAVESNSPDSMSASTQAPGSSSTATPSSQATASPTEAATSTPDHNPAVPSAPAATQPSTAQPVTTPGDSGYTGDDADSDYVAPTRADWEEEDMETAGVESETTEITIPAKAPSKKITTSNYELSKKNKLTITAPGTYVIQTEDAETVTDGLIEVDYSDDAADGTAHLILNGVNLTSSNNTEPTSDTGLITIKSSVTKAVITLADGSTNMLTDTGATGIDKADATSTTYTAGIVCKKTPLTINGSGSLNILSTNGNGIKCTNLLKILDATIAVSGPNDAACGHNGISGKLGVFVKDANLNVHSDGDCLKTTLDETDIADDATLADLGNMELDGGTYLFVSENGDAVSATRTLYLNPVSLNATTKNAAGTTTDGSYKGIKAGTTIYVPATAGTITSDTTATYSASRASGDSNDSLADDTLHCDGYILIEGGSFTLASGDDGIHADAGLVIKNGTINVTASYEGLEGADISIQGGDITIVSRDDGINAAGGSNSSSSSMGPGFGGDDFHKGDSSSSTQYQIIIEGGNINIDASGDGIDSNGNIFFKGGTVIVNGPTNNGNGALDYGDDADCVCEISGGTLIAAGAFGMAAAPTSGSSQPAVNVILSSTQAAGTYVVLKDSDGNTVLQAQPSKSFQSVVMSCEDLKLGNTYQIYYGSDLSNLTQSGSVTFTSTSMSTGNSSSGGGWNFGGGGFGGRPGGR